MKHRNPARAFQVMVAAALVGSAAGAHISAGAQATDVLYFADTGHNLYGEFLLKYRAASDPTAYGLPITEQFTESNGRLVQYFERARFELHTELPVGQQVVLTPVGRLLYTPLAPLDIHDPSHCQEFVDTGYWVCFDFLDFFNQHGGATRFGLPISPFDFQDGHLVQYFETARLDWRPDLPPGQRVTEANLGLLYFQHVGGDLQLLAPVPALTSFATATGGVYGWTATPSLTPFELASPPDTSTPILVPQSLTPTDTTAGPAATTETPTPLLPETSTGTLPPTETLTSALTPTDAPTFTATATVEPSSTPTSTPTVTSTTPSAAVLFGTVTQLSNCRYGPGAGYLYKYGLLKGNRLAVIGRNAAGSWIYVRAIRGHNPCWLNASLMQVEGDVMTVPEVTPVLPESPYYRAPTGVYATRSGSRVEITWNAVPLRAGDSSEQYDYLVETWVCQGGQQVFVPVGTNELAVTVTDEVGCAEPSHGRVYTSEKHGYSIPAAEVRWP